MGTDYHVGVDAPWAPLCPLTDAEVEAIGAGRCVVRDGVIGPDSVRRALAAVRRRFEAGQLRAAGVGHGRAVDRSVRGDHIQWIDEAGEDPVLASLWAWFEAVRVEVNQACWLGLQRFSVQIACYPGEGALYRRHVDALPGARNRVLTGILYLNPDWRPEHGGQLRVLLGDGPEDIAPVGGRLVLFRSEAVVHEVLPTWAERFTVTAWFRGAEAVPMLDDPDV